MKMLDGLRRARALVERGWTKGEPARNAAGEGCHPSSQHAVEWSAFGAIYATVPTYADYLAACARLQDLIGASPEDLNLSLWNDAPGRTQADVLDLFDRAIAAES